MFWGHDCDAVVADGDEEESEELVGQVLDELGCNIDAQFRRSR